MAKKSLPWTALLLANVFAWGVLSLYEPSRAAPQAGKQPFSNAVEQRNEIIAELQRVRAAIEEQNQLLRAQLRQEAKK